WSVTVFWLGEFDFPPILFVSWRAPSLGFGGLSLKKKSVVFRNSKSSLNATGSGETFSTILGSTRSRAASLGPVTAKKLKAKRAATNLIHLIKPGFESGVNEQRAYSRPQVTMELTRI